VTNPTPHYNKTRLAPTPSGFLHLGNVLSFCITAALAQKHGAKILLRIDDLDRTRVNNQYVQDIFDALNFLEIPWDEGPRDVKEFEESYSQLHRMHLYRDALKQFADDKLVFACECSRLQLNSKEYSCECLSKQIPLNTENTSWRLITKDKAELAIKNYNGQTIQAALPADMHNFVIKRKDGLPAYQLTSVIDDLYYGVDLIVRGEDLWSSTLAQHQLATVLREDDFNEITFYHHPLLTETSGKKLSKSAGSTSVHYLRQNRKKASDIFTHIAAMLGINETVNNWQQLAGIIEGS